MQKNKMESTSQLTIIIPFLNEGQEVVNTLESIQETAITKPNIMLINDDSNDGYDYKSAAEKYGCRYIYHKDNRMGVAASRDEGVAMSETEYFLLLDAHMRFYEIGWDKKLISLLEKYPRAILCSQTKKLKKNEKDEVVDKDAEVVNYCGGYIDDYLKVTWNYHDRTPYSVMTEIPCILGAAYATNKSYWQKLRGLEGLIYYGTDEELISIKAWCEGGKCLLVKNWVVGHIYRSDFPYQVYNKEVIYNRLYVAELLLPYAVKAKMFYGYEKSSNKHFNEAYEILKQNYPKIKEQRDYLKKIFTRPIEYFLQFNKLIQETNNKNT